MTLGVMDLLMMRYQWVSVKGERVVEPAGRWASASRQRVRAVITTPPRRQGMTGAKVVTKVVTIESSKGGAEREFLTSCLFVCFWGVRTPPPLPPSIYGMLFPHMFNFSEINTIVSDLCTVYNKTISHCCTEAKL